MKVTENFVLFWGGPFSQWYQHTMIINGVLYNCAEQYMMARKAEMFGDREALSAIMSTKDPKKQKELGRKVKGFNGAKWEPMSRLYVFEANYAKFSNPELKKVLLDTGSKEIVEASPYDTIWGIGLGEDDPRALDKAQWRGKNWLGEILMEVREVLEET